MATVDDLSNALRSRPISDGNKATNHPPQQQHHHVVKGVKGVRLKHFESVVALLLPVIQPKYVLLPPVPNGDTDNKNDWPFDNRFPAAAGVLGDLPGQLSHPERAERKENQIRSMLRCILALIPTESSSSSAIARTASSSSFTIVDFGGGSGHLSIPLALLLPSCNVICVDLGEHSLDLLHQKTAQCGPSNSDDSSRGGGNKTQREPLQTCSTSIPNLFTFHGAAGAYTESFDMAVALHLCGEATDVVLRLAGKAKAASIVVAPCCVGKLSRDSKNPYIYQATGQNTPTVQYPQSSQFCRLIREQCDWSALAKAADYSDSGECRTSRNAARRTAKALLETDRRLYLEEVWNYKNAMTRMEPWECTPKNDIVVAWRDTESPPRAFTTYCEIDKDSEADIQLTVDHLLIPSLSNSGGNNKQSGGSKTSPLDRVDWTHEEEEETRNQLTNYFFLADIPAEEVLVFPTRMGGRKRKLVHYVAEQMNLAHWCEGKGNANKTVAVARRGRRLRQEYLFANVAT